MRRRQLESLKYTSKVAAQSSTNRAVVLRMISSTGSGTGAQDRLLCRLLSGLCAVCHLQAFDWGSRLHLAHENDNEVFQRLSAIKGLVLD